MEIRTLCDLFYHSVDTRHKAAHLRFKRDGAWLAMSSAELRVAVEELSMGLCELGVGKGDRVAILSENRPEWALADFASLTAAAIDVPLYASLTPQQVLYILNDSEARAVFVANALQARKVAEIRPHAAGLEHVIRMEDGPGFPEGTLSLDEVRARGRAALVRDKDAVRKRAALPQPEDVATLIYTSGTTGDPKGVMLTHANLVSNVKGSLVSFRGVGADDTALSFLPLCHVFERMGGHYLMLYVGATIAYAESVEHVPANMLELRPTIMLSVPRLYEKMYARVNEKVAADPPARQRIFRWAMEVGRRGFRCRVEKARPSLPLRLELALAERLVFAKIKARTGGRLRLFVSGGAPLAREIAEFFGAVGLPILEGYGLTETSPVIAVNTLDDLKPGTVGRPIPGVEVKIAADGEILTRGPHVMKGYYRQPEATAEAIDAEGWFHTGDVGLIDADGFLAITDRKKDIIVTSGGKNIAPQPIENALKTHPLIAEIVMIGNRRNFPSALVVPNFANLEKWAQGGRLPYAGREELVERPEVQALYERTIGDLTRNLARFEQIKRVAVLPREFSLEAGELTPTLKVKRRFVEQKYKDIIDRLYEGNRRVGKSFRVGEADLVSGVRQDIDKAVVLGAGTMGAQVAAHLVGQGVQVVLLDMVPPAAEAGERSALARRGIDMLRKLKPSPLHLPEHAALIRPGNFEDDWHELEGADWVFEAVVEDLEVKRQLFARVAPAAKPTALLTSNTSGLGIASMSAHLPAELRRRFFGTHFFNPPRYLKLLETIPGPDTDPDRLAAMEAWCEGRLGKGVVRCKDTPNFIANRIGAYSLGVALRTMVELDLTIEDVDALTGPLIGRARSATFRTCDIAGVDVCARVSENLYRAVPHDPARDAFRLPEFVRTMVERGWLGEKTGAGFYRKEGGEIRVLDWKTLEYRERRKAALPPIAAAQSVADVPARIRQLLRGGDTTARFLERVLSGTSLYAASLLPEIADDVASVDRAMEWGYGWGLGPFRLLDELGVASLAALERSSGRPVPALVEALLGSGRQRFYEPQGARSTMFGPGGVAPVPERPGVIDVAAVKARGGLKKKNAGASLVDLGDGVGLVEFHSKLNTLGFDAFGMMSAAVKEGRDQFDALVIGNQGEQFSAGANLMLVLMAVQDEEWDELDLSIRQFQDANMALKYAPLPVVAAPFGLTLGGGCEISLHAARLRASAETYMGLVEVGVGLVPAGGGTKELALRALDRCAGVEGADPFPFLKRAFELIAFAKVSGSGAEALRLFGRAGDSLSPHPDRLVADAKQVALGLARAGWRPERPRAELPALGRPALAVFKAGIHNAARARRISEHDALVATRVAAILCGGDREPGSVSEQQLLDLEREAFLSLLGTQKTRERIQHMLKQGKPLRN